MFSLFRSKNPLKNHVQSEMSPYDAHALHKLLGSFGRTDLRILEIGSWFGAGSTQIFSNYAELIVCVDHWKGNENETHRRLASELNPFQIFKENTFAFADRLIAIHADSKKIGSLLREQTFDLIFIDGDHRYAQTKLDIMNTLPLVKKGGILCGHDCEGRPTESNRATLGSLLASDHTKSIFINFKEMHPGVILAVDECLDNVSLFAEEQFQIGIDGKDARGYSSIWYKQM